MFKKKFLPVSQIIYKTIKQNINKHDRILEVGCASCHISSVLKQNGFNIKGIEIRKDEAEKVSAELKAKNLNFEIINEDILNHNDHYDILWCSGLIQCLNENQKEIFFRHFTKIANNAIFFVPMRINYLAPDSKHFQIAVSGCEEFPTGNIPFTLSKYYSKVKYNIIPKNKIKMDFDFVYYICEN